MSSTPTPARPDAAEIGMAGAPLPLWRNRDYVLLWSGQLVSQIGSGVSQIAYPLLILALTHSAAEAGVVGALYSIPYIILSLPAGALIDRWNRKLVMIACDIGRAAALGSIPIAAALGHLTLAQLYITATVEGTLFVFFNIAEVACLPRVVTGSQIPVASAQNQGSQIISALVGPPIGGVLFSLARSIPFAADAISYGASVLSLSFIRTRFQGERTAERRPLRTEIAEGVTWLWRQKLIRFMAVITGGLNLTGAASGLAVIVLAQHQHASPAAIGLIFSIGSIGGLAGAALAPRIQRSFAFGPVIVTTLWISALTYLGLAVAPNPVLLGVVLAASFITGPIYNAVQFTYRIRATPDALQGRVNSAYRLVGYGFQPLGFVLSGVLIGVIGAVSTVLVFGGVGITLAVAATLNRQVREAQAVDAAAGS